MNVIFNFFFKQSLPRSLHNSTTGAVEPWTQKQATESPSRREGVDVNLTVA